MLGDFAMSRLFVIFANNILFGAVHLLIDDSDEKY